MVIKTRSLNLLQPGVFVNKWRISGHICSSRKNALKIGFVLILTILCFYLQSANTWAGTDGDPTALIRNGAYAVTRDGKIIASHNLDQPLIPASICKLLTGLAGLAYLGTEHRFETGFYQDDNDNLYIKGYGDPFLVSEEVALISAELHKTGITAINHIYLDDSSFALADNVDGAGDSLNPYDVASGGLTVNFNTINLKIAPDGKITSAEPQTPLLPLMSELGKNLAPGEHRINISTNKSNIPQLTGELFGNFLESAGIKVNGQIASRKVPESGRLVYTHLSSKTLTDLLEGLLLYSNNFIANQIFLTAGAKLYGYPATWEKGRKAMAAFIDKDKLLANAAIKLAEGSGLSRNNRLTARAMLHILDRFKPYARLLPEGNGVRIKSGTLTGVYSYAGYFRENGNPDGFVIILNQPVNNRDEILQILQKIYNKKAE